MSLQAIVEKIDNGHNVYINISQMTIRLKWSPTTMTITTNVVSEVYLKEFYDAESSPLLQADS